LTKADVQRLLCGYVANLCTVAEPNLVRENIKALLADWHEYMAAVDSAFDPERETK
jgi:hypothetical protein